MAAAKQFLQRASPFVAIATAGRFNSGGSEHGLPSLLASGRALSLAAQTRALSAPFGPGPEPRSGSSWPPWGGGAPMALGHLGTLRCQRAVWPARAPFSALHRGVSRLGTALPGAGGRA